MYAALWKVMPGKPILKVAQLVIIAAIAVAVLFAWVFPFIAETFFVEQSTIR